jgi:glycosyltransferase involved in cell wall biosynthesis
MDKLTIILPTEASFEESEKRGLLSIWKSRFHIYSKYFTEVEVYSFDFKDFSSYFSHNVKCHVIPLLNIRIAYLKHFFYNLYLLYKARKMSNPIRAISTTYFILPVIRVLFKKHIILSFQYAYAETSKRDFGIFRGFLGDILERLSIAGSQTIIATTEELRRYLLRKYGRHAIVIPNFVDTDVFSASSEKNDYILYAGRLIRSKGLNYLLTAFQAINKRFPDFKLKIAGGTEMEVELYREKVKELGLKEIEFLGSVEHDEIAKVMKRALAIVLPTVTREGLPKVLLEAMACGTVCIATDVPGSRDLITDGVNGLLVPPKDSDSLAEAIMSVISDKEMREKLTRNGFETSRKYSIQKVLKDEVEIIMNIHQRNTDHLKYLYN